MIEKIRNVLIGFFLLLILGCNSDCQVSCDDADSYRTQKLLLYRSLTSGSVSERAVYGHYFIDDDDSYLISEIVNTVPLHPIREAKIEPIKGVRYIKDESAGVLIHLKLISSSTTKQVWRAIWYSNPESVQWFEYTLQRTSDGLWKILEKKPIAQS